MILDRHGHPIQSQASGTNTDPGLRGGWVRTSSGGIERPSSVSQLTGTRLSRHVERTAARLAYLTNPLVFGAVEILLGIVLGESITYGEHPDEKVSDAWAEFWEVNTLHDMAERAFREYMTDGELLTLWPTGSAELRRRPDQPARIGLYDVSMGWTYETIPGLPSEIDEVLTDNNNLHPAGTFAYQAHLGGMWNDPRGWPVLMQSVPAALAYINFLNSRIRLHRVQSRINGIYRAFIDPRLDAESQREALSIRAEAFSGMPADGSVITIGMDPNTGNSEGFDFPNYDKKAVDSSEDGRLLRMLFAVGLNLPLLLLSDGEDSNLATGTAQLKGVVIALRRRQQITWRWMQALGRTELKRRYGPAEEYTVEKLARKGTQIIRERDRVTADMIELPVHLPEITDEDGEMVLKKIEYARSQGWLSDQGGAGMLGIDLLQELEQMAAENEGAGEENEEPPPPETSQDGDDDEEQGEEREPSEARRVHHGTRR